MTIYTYCRHSWFQICDFSHLSKTLQSDLMSWFPLHKYPDPCFLQINQFSVYLIFKYTSSVEKNRIYVKTNSCEWCNFRLSFCTVWIKAKKHNHMSDNIVKVKALKWHSLKCEFFSINLNLMLTLFIQFVLYFCCTLISCKYQCTKYLIMYLMIDLALNRLIYILTKVNLFELIFICLSVPFKCRFYQGCEYRSHWSFHFRILKKFSNPII